MKMRKTTYIVYGLIVIFLLQHCGDEDTEETDYVNYSLESDKVGQLITDFDIGIKFNNPENWEKRTTEASRKVEKRGVYGGYLGEFVYEPKYVFFDDSSLSVLSLGKIIPPDSIETGENLLNYYAQAISDKQKQDDSFEVDQFVKDDIKFTIFTIKKSNIISKRLVFQNKFYDLIQFEYTSRASSYSSEQEKIKQSIGSIKLL